MRIAIFTLPLQTNYGGILQAYALQTLLEEMGHEVKVINKEQRFRPMPRHRWAEKEGVSFGSSAYGQVHS